MSIAVTVILNRQRRLPLAAIEEEYTKQAESKSISRPTPRA
jgi:hypothetical protein